MVLRHESQRIKLNYLNKLITLQNKAVRFIGAGRYYD